MFFGFAIGFTLFLDDMLKGFGMINTSVWETPESRQLHLFTATYLVYFKCLVISF